MRISTAWAQQSALNNILQRGASLSRTEAHVASDKKLLNAADDPVAAVQAQGLQHVEHANQQYQRNIGSATNRLEVEESSLSQVTTILQRARTLALGGTSATQSETDRQADAAELKQLFAQLVQVANAKDEHGDSLFAGNAAHTVPFARGSGFSVTYAGDQGQRMVAAAPGMQVATSDPGSTLFMDIPAGNGKFVVDAAPANTGALTVGASSVSDPAAFTGGNYTVTFAADGAWQATDGGGATVATGTYAEGGSLAFGGMQIQLDGEPATGDILHIQSGTTQSVFASVGNLIQAFESTPPGTASSNVVNRQIEGIDQSLGQVLDVRAEVGARLSTLDQQKSEGADLSVQYQGALSNLQDLDMASAISKLDLQKVALEAAQQTFVQVQGLSLFNYLR